MGRLAVSPTTHIVTVVALLAFRFFFSSRRRHTRCSRDWSSDVCSSDLRNAWKRRSRNRQEKIPLYAYDPQQRLQQSQRRVQKVCGGDEKGLAEFTVQTPLNLAPKQRAQIQDRRETPSGNNDVALLGSCRLGPSQHKDDHRKKNGGPAFHRLRP